MPSVIGHRSHFKLQMLAGSTCRVVGFVSFHCWTSCGRIWAAWAYRSKTAGSACFSISRNNAPPTLRPHGTVDGAMHGGGRHAGPERRLQEGLGAYPGPDYTIPLGRAARVREGRDVTIVTYGALVHRALVAAKLAALDGIDVEILDLRSLSPYDWEAIAGSVRKTGKVLVAHEDSKSWGYGAEIAARIGEELFEHLDAPVRRIGALDTFVGYHPVLEEAILPQVSDLVAAIGELARY